MSGRISVAPKADRTLDGITFASKAEMNRYAELCMLQRARLIEGLERQPRFELQPKLDITEFGDKKPRHTRAIFYVADFRYRNLDTNSVIVEDVKGHLTDIYKLKRKLFRAKYPEIDFREIKV